MRDNARIQQKILIATTNEGKFREISLEFKDLPFTLVSLREVKLDTLDVEEPYNTTWENAVHKAKVYAEKSKLLTIAEDTGFFIRALKGAPGIKAKRFAPTPEEACKKVLTMMKGVPRKNRQAYFETTGVLVDPHKQSVHMFSGSVKGYIAEKHVGKAPAGMIYDPIFYFPPAEKYFSELTIAEKNLVSHRGQVVTQLKLFLSKHYGFKQIMVPLAIIVRDGKILLLKRRDSRPEFNNKWEFPGGGVEKGETVDQCIIRECKEETGFTVQIQERSPGILTHYEPKWNYQVFLMTHICTVKGGKLKLMDNENSGYGWFAPEEATKQNLLPLNKKIIEQNMPLIKRYC